MIMAQAARPIPIAPSGFDPDRFFAGIYWHQKWQLFDGIHTPGKNSVEEMCAALNLPVDLSGKRVLDIGAWNGCLSFECERRGAREVIALGPEDPERAGFYRLRDALGSTRTHYLLGSAYDLDPDRLGYFDVVLFCGVLYHLRYPLLGIDNIRRVCTGEVFVETVVSDLQLLVPQRGGVKKVPLRKLSPVLLQMPLWQFYRLEELNQDASNWFGPNASAVVQAFESAGFTTTVLKNDGRATFHAKVREGAPEFLRIASAEGVFYDTLVGHLFGGDRLTLGSPSEQALVAVLASDEYLRLHDNSPEAWLAGIYPRLLGRPAGLVELQASQKPQLAGDPGHRQVVVRRIVQGTEYRSRLLAAYFRRFLGRLPSGAEVQTWLGIMTRQGTTDEYLLAFLLGSEEAFVRQGSEHRRWLDQVYRELLARPRDASSDAWVALLDRGQGTRPEIVGNILVSDEYRRLYRQALARLYLGQPGGEGDTTAAVQVLAEGDTGQPVMAA
jgi:tRNA (mo5U34)-methyltransferase